MKQEDGSDTAESKTSYRKSPSASNGKVPAPTTNNTAVPSDARGFLVIYNSMNDNNDDTKHASKALQLLNRYTDKLYRSKGVTCWLKIHTIGHNCLFVESDIESPRVVVDAIYTDLVASTIDKSCLEIVKCWTR